jgi:hypothetical protein
MEIFQMKGVVKVAAVAAAIAGGALFASAPAEAGISIGINLGIPVIGVPGAIAYDNDSGGYCDNFGCPDGYWDQPVWYGPVYYGGGWYQGPVYYRDIGGEHLFWIHGGWHRDEWRGPHPGWWRADYRFGPALGFSWYQGHGFHIPQHHLDYWHAHGGHGGMMGPGDHPGGMMMMGVHDDHKTGTPPKHDDHHDDDHPHP